MTDTLAPDIRLVAACLAGNGTAFRLLLARHQAGVTEYAFSLTGDLARAEEIAREAFLEAFQNLHRLRQNSSFGNWVMALARTAWRARREGERTAAPPAATPLLPGTGGDGLPAGLDRDRARSIGQALASIPKSFRETVILRHMNRLPAAEIARIRSETPGAIALRLARAHGMLRALAGGPILAGEGIESAAGAPPCGRKRERLSLLVTGDIEPGERGVLEQHLEGCDTCRRDLTRTRRFLGEIDAYLKMFAGRPPLLTAPPTERWRLGIAVAAAVFGVAALLFWQSFAPSGILAGQPRGIPFDLEVTVSREGPALVRDLRLLLDLRPDQNEIVLRDVSRAIEPGSARVAVEGEEVAIEEEPEEGSVRIFAAGGSASRREAELTYLLDGISWRAEYEVVVHSGDALDLAGWVILRNEAGFDREGARLRLLSSEDGESDGAAVRSALRVLADAGAGPPDGFELRAFPSPVRLRSGTRRFPLARARDLPFTRITRLELDRPIPLRTVARIRTQDGVGLELPLPPGDVKVLAGAEPPVSFEGGLGSTPDGDGIDIPIGGAPGVTFVQGVLPSGEAGRLFVDVTNARAEPVEVEVRVSVPAGSKVSQVPAGARVEGGALSFPLRIEGRAKARAEWRLAGR